MRDTIWSRTNEARVSARRNRILLAWFAATLFTFSVQAAGAENCLSSSDMDAAMRTALLAAAQRDFELVAKGDSASLRQNAIPGVSGDFGGIEASVKANQSALAGSRGMPRPAFLLMAEGTAPIQHAEFLCGVFGKDGQTPDSAVFYLDNLPPGKYGIVILDIPTPGGARTVSLILLQQGADWKMAGLQIRAVQSVGHDSDWFATRAREFKNKGQMHNAWLYYLEARSLISPLPFMSTAATDKLYDESQKMQPADFPADGKSTALTAGTATYRLTALFPDAVGNDLGLIVKYQAQDIANSNQTYQINVAVMKALVTKFPELRDAFSAVVVRAVDPSGHDFGTLRPMKDIK